MLLDDLPTELNDQIDLFIIEILKLNAIRPLARAAIDDFDADGAGIQ